MKTGKGKGKGTGTGTGKGTDKGICKPFVDCNKYAADILHASASVRNNRRGVWGVPSYLLRMKKLGRTGEQKVRTP